jgi:membrane protease subunit (stomatin/prohibitin family)
VLFGMPHFHNCGVYAQIHICDAQLKYLCKHGEVLDFMQNQGFSLPSLQALFKVKFSSSSHEILEEILQKEDYG